MKRLSAIALASLLTLLVTPIATFAQSVDQADASRTEVTEMRERAQVRAVESQTSTKQRTTEIKKQVQERRAQVKQDVCERRQQSLTSAMPRLSRGATSVKQSMDTTYDRIVGFYEKGQLSVENYSELVGAVEVAKANAEAAIETVESQTFTLDCKNPSVGQQLDGFRSAVRSAKSALHNYKKSLVDLISAMRATASTEQNRKASHNE